MMLALIPGLPKLPFLIVGGAVWFLAGRLPTDEALRGTLNKRLSSRYLRRRPPIPPRGWLAT